jgi:uncharacterized Fe-S cluster-containing radical SAM superfamily protein
MAEGMLAEKPLIGPDKFCDPDITAKGERRAVVALTRLRTLWFNTGSLCNITCKNCYMESSPRNDSLAYLTFSEFGEYLDEIERHNLPTEEIAFTGGEPFMNAELPAMMAHALDRGHRALVLTNAMKPLLNKRARLLALQKRHEGKLTLRVSIDHYTRARHEAIRGEGSWEPMLAGLKWLVENSFGLAVAGRTCWNESDIEARAGYAALFAGENIPVDAADPAKLVLFPEMDAQLDVPEITVHCWDILGVEPSSIMCATSRMVIKRKGAARPVVVPCTLLPYDPQFELGNDLAGSAKTVKLNHPHCTTFCILGGAACSYE